jgi:hypothetical protein
MSDGREELVLKSYVGGAGPIGARFDEIQARRRVLEGSSIETPRLYAARNATVLEEYIPMTLPEALQDPSRARIVFRAILDAGAELDRLGFKGVSLFEDMRSRGSDAVLVDFGADLGGMGSPSKVNGAAALAFVSRHAHGAMSLGSVVGDTPPRVGPPPSRRPRAEHR